MGWLDQLTEHDCKYWVRSDRVYSFSLFRFPFFKKSRSDRFIGLTRSNPIKLDPTRINKKKKVKKLPCFDLPDFTLFFGTSSYLPTHVLATSYSYSLVTIQTLKLKHIFSSLSFSCLSLSSSSLQKRKIKASDFQTIFIS